MQPGLSFFINRAKVFQLYRALLIEARHLPTATKHDVRAQIRREFKANISADPASVNLLLSQGETQLKALRNQISLSGAEAPHEQQQQQQHFQQQQHQEPHDADDERGRIGQGWPWQQ